MKLRPGTEIATGIALLAGLALVALPSAAPLALPPLLPVEAGSRLESGPEASLAVRRAQAERAGRLAFGPDPFRPRHAAAPLAVLEGSADGRLTGVSLRAGERWAILGREVVREGDVLASGALVREITRTSVTLARAGREWTLTLGEAP